MFGTRRRTPRKISYRSPPSVPSERNPHGVVKVRGLARIFFFILGVSVLGLIFIVPIIILESMDEVKTNSNNFVYPKTIKNNHDHISLHNLIDNKKLVKDVMKGLKDIKAAAARDSHDLFELHNHEDESELTLARGYAGLPMDQTPALKGAHPGIIKCDVDVNDLAYWNRLQGFRDRTFQTPYQTAPNQYLTFEPDPGGWNNIRISLEIIYVIAAATGRTLVLPPSTPMYLLGQGIDHVRPFGNFYPLSNPELRKRLHIISMPEFVKKEGKRLLHLDEQEIDKLMPVAKNCLHQPNSDLYCEKLYGYLRKAGLQPPLQAHKNCLVFDEDHFHGKPITEDVQGRVAKFCGTERTPVYYNQTLHSPDLIHWNADEKTHRILNHFYTFVYFTDPKVDNHFKRFVRDFLHYTDDIYCAAGKIVHALDQEHQNAGWSSLHVRRGDLQYKEVKISAEEWYENTKDIWKPGEVLFIATDERNKTFFDPIKKHHTVRFLDDYWDMAKLKDLDPFFLGMVDTIIASHGRAFAGTWFSTFSGYINRMRGYLGYSIKDSWYGWNERKVEVREWQYPHGNYPAREWPIGWVGIDGDKYVDHETSPTTPAQNKVPQRKLEIGLSDLQPDEGFQAKPVARGVAGRALSQTPALNGATRAHIECDVNVDSLAYWNDLTGEKDRNFESPFQTDGEEKFISFSVDRGGWNNIRMSMEIIFVIAAATGRTLVLPPKEPLYRLRADKKDIYRGYTDFFNLNTPEFEKRLKIISMEEFVKKHGGSNGIVPVPEEMRKNVEKSAAHCDKRKKSNSFCGQIDDFLDKVGFVAEIEGSHTCVVFDNDLYAGNAVATEHENSIKKFCGERNQFVWTKELNDHPLIHFQAGEKHHRLLTHFYDFVHFTDPAVDNHYKRFVRDFLHYNDQIYCVAGKIVKAVQAEAKQYGFNPDEEGAGGFSAMHIRRGELQYKKVKISAEEWYENTKNVWKPNEILYIATDERNKTFFDPIAEHHQLRFLDDYFEIAGLKDIDPNYFGMIDTIIASRGRAFAGTFFSTFSGYINRLRGYHGMSMKDSWYSLLERKTRMHEWEDIDHYVFSYEWPTGWVGIDADVVPTKDVF